MQEELVLVSLRHAVLVYEQTHSQDSFDLFFFGNPEIAVIWHSKGHGFPFATELIETRVINSYRRYEASSFYPAL